MAHHLRNRSAAPQTGSAQCQSACSVQAKVHLFNQRGENALGLYVLRPVLRFRIQTLADRYNFPDLDPFLDPDPTYCKGIKIF
jgi:hypothetical protein